MLDIPLAAVESAITALSPGARGVAIADRAPLDADARSESLRVTWEADGVIHLDQLIARLCPSSSAGEAEARLLRTLTGAGLAVPRLLFDQPVESGRLLLLTQVPGQPLADLVRSADMRWELSALAFTYARALARIHALDWASLVPWLADPEDAPEDIVDEHVDALWEDWDRRIAALPPRASSLLSLCARAVTWLDLRRPVEVSICLCHGDYRPANVLLDADELSGIVGWERARVTDAAFDLALLSFQVSRLGRDTADIELFVQAALGAYLQSSPRSLGNLAFFTVARLLTHLLDLVDAERQTERDLASLRVEQVDVVAAIERAMATADRVPWRG